MSLMQKIQMSLLYSMVCACECACVKANSKQLYTQHTNPHGLIPTNKLGNETQKHRKFGEKMFEAALHLRQHDTIRHLPCSVSIGGHNKDAAGVYLKELQFLQNIG